MERAHNIRTGLSKLCSFFKQHASATGGGILPSAENLPSVGFKITQPVLDYAVALNVKLTGLQACGDSDGPSMQHRKENMPPNIPTIAQRPKSPSFLYDHTLYSPLLQHTVEPQATVDSQTAVESEAAVESQAAANRFSESVEEVIPETQCTEYVLDSNDVENVVTAANRSLGENLSSAEATAANRSSGGNVSSAQAIFDCDVPSTSMPMQRQFFPTEAQRGRKRGASKPLYLGEKIDWICQEKKHREKMYALESEIKTV